MAYSNNFYLAMLSGMQSNQADMILDNGGHKSSWRIGIVTNLANNISIFNAIARTHTQEKEKSNINAGGVKAMRLL